MDFVPLRFWSMNSESLKKVIEAKIAGKQVVTQPNAPDGYHLEVTVLAESIQAAPSTAVEGAWAVTVVNGALTSAIPTA